MKRTILSFLLVGAIAGGVVWLIKNRPPSPPVASSASSQPERKILYYQSPMHPWIKSDKPGKCPICGMNLVPIYADDESTNTSSGLKLSSDSVNVVNVQTATVENREITRSLKVAGAIEMGGHSTDFVFLAYERDFIWLEAGQNVEVTLPALPGKTFTAKINQIDRNDPTHGIQVHATLSENPSNVPGAKSWRPFDGFYAEGRVIVNLPEVLAIPRSAVLSPGEQPIVYVDAGGGRYESRNVTLGRVGDEYVEVLDGLKEDEKVVTSGGVLIDAEAQISQSTDN
jgi:hypothetical protein